MNQKLLIIDDSPDLHTLVRATLAGEAIEIQSAHGSEEGLRMATALKPDAILLDAEMRDGTGPGTLNRLKEDSNTVATPVILLTARASLDQKLAGLNLGALDFLAQPSGLADSIDQAELRARVRSALHTKYLLDLLATKGMIDGFTGLWNNAYFIERLKIEIAAIVRSPRPLGCVLVDVDQLKAINERYGHAVGDEVLRHIAKVFQHTCRAEDIICRCSGEEFAILTPGIGVVGATTLAERLRIAITDLGVTHDGEIIEVTCSFGIADSGTCGSASMYSAAQRAMERAKSLGRDRIIDCLNAA